MLYRWLCVISLLLVVPVMLFCQLQNPEALLSGFSPKDILNLEKGKIVLAIEELANHDVLVKAYLLFNKQPEVSWKILSSTALEKEYMKVIVELHSYPVNAGEDRVNYVIQWLFFKKKFRLIHYYDHTLFLMRWLLDPAYDNDLDQHTGYWQLYTYKDNRTLAEYAGNMAVKGLPRWFENLVKAEVIRLTLTDIKEYINKY